MLRMGRRSERTRMQAPPLVRARFLAISMMLALAGPVVADGMPGDVCDIAVDPRMSVYVVLVGNAPYQNKRYVTWDDALKLREIGRAHV